MLKDARQNARRVDQRVTLTYTTTAADEYGRTSFGTPVDGESVYAEVKRMSANRTLLTFQLADVVGLEITMRMPASIPNGIKYDGHDVHFTVPEDVNGRGRLLRILGYYQIDV